MRGDFPGTTLSPLHSILPRGRVLEAARENRLRKLHDLQREGDERMFAKNPPLASFDAPRKGARIQRRRNPLDQLTVLSQRLSAGVLGQRFLILAFSFLDGSANRLGAFIAFFAQLGDQLK